MRPRLAYLAPHASHGARNGRRACWRRCRASSTGSGASSSSHRGCERIVEPPCHRSPVVTRPVQRRPARHRTPARRPRPLRHGAADDGRHLARRARRRAPTTEIEAAFALGATRWQVLRRVVVPSAQNRHPGCNDARDGPGTRRDDRGDDGHRQHADGLPTRSSPRPQTMASVIANEFTEATEPFHLSALIAVAADPARRRGARQRRRPTPRAIGQPPAARAWDRHPMTVMATDPVLARRAEIQRIAAASQRRRKATVAAGHRLACRLFLVVALIPLGRRPRLRRDPGCLPPGTWRSSHTCPRLRGSRAAASGTRSSAR